MIKKVFLEIDFHRIKYLGILMDNHLNKTELKITNIVFDYIQKTQYQ